jgi:CheY-like chemotaxis protein
VGRSEGSGNPGQQCRHDQPAHPGRRREQRRDGERRGGVPGRASHVDGWPGEQPYEHEHGHDREHAERDAPATGQRGQPAAGQRAAGRAAADGRQAVDRARRLRVMSTPVDVVLMGIRMPVLDGLTATRELLAEPVEPPTRVLVLTTFDIDDYVYDALRASGFLLKTPPPLSSLPRSGWSPPATRCSPRR